MSIKITFAEREFYFEDDSDGVITLVRDAAVDGKSVMVEHLGGKSILVFGTSPVVIDIYDD